MSVPLWAHRRPLESVAAPGASEATSSICIGFPSSATPLYCFCAFNAASFVA